MVTDIEGLSQAGCFIGTTIEFADSFDGYTNLLDIYPTSGNPGTNTSGAGRLGTNGHRLVNGAQGLTFLTLPITKMKWANFAMRALWAASGTPRGIWRWRDAAGGTTHTALYINSSGQLIINRGGTTVVTSASSFPSDGAHHWVNFGSVIDDTNGYVSVWVDGVLFAEFSGDTQNGGNATIDGFDISSTSNDGAGQTDYDDVIISNVRLGDTTCYTILPTGNGNTSQFVGSDSNSVDNYLLVDESAPNSDTDYIQSGTPGDKDLWVMGNTGVSGGAVIAVVSVLTAKKTDAGGRTIAPIVRENSTESTGAAVNLNTSYLTTYSIFHTKPSGGAWDTTSVDALELGVTITA